MANFKTVIGFDDYLSNRTQNHAPTSYAIGKMRAGRTPRSTDGSVITDANKLFRPGLYFLEAGALHTNNDGTESTAPAYLYNLVQDPDESLHGGHALNYTLAQDLVFVTGKDYYINKGGVYIRTEVTIGAQIPANTYYVKENTDETWHKNVTMNFRQILYTNDEAFSSATTRIGMRDTAIASLLRRSYAVVALVRNIETELGTAERVGTINAYAYVSDIAMWIRYSVSRVDTTISVIWEPAITWGDWKSITGDNTMVRLDKDMDAQPGLHYVSFGQHVLTLPDANSCNIGSTVILDQWSSTGTVRTFTSDKSAILYEMNTHPGIKDIGLCDMKIHDDSLIATGSLFTKNLDMSWTHISDDVRYYVGKVTLKPNDVGGEGKQRYALYILDENNNIKMKRLCYTDLVYPYEPSIVYNFTSDTKYSDAKVYYKKVTAGGQDNFVELVKGTDYQVGDDIPLYSVYEASSVAEWYDAGNRAPSDIAESEIKITLTKTHTNFTINDVDGNVTGATTYTFEVTYKDLSYKQWSLTRCSDLEATMAKIEETWGTEILSQGNRITALESSTSTTASEVDLLKHSYVLRDKAIRLLSQNAIYGDNAQVTGEDLITFDESFFLDPSSLTESSYTINYFRARFNPIYYVAKFNGSLRSVYLPTRPFTKDGVLMNKGLIGAHITFYLEPGAKISVVDDCSSRHTSYTFEGITSTGDVPTIVIVEFTLMQYVQDDGTYGYAWIWNRKTSNTDCSNTTQEAMVSHILDDLLAVKEW